MVYVHMIKNSNCKIPFLVCQAECTELRDN